MSEYALRESPLPQSGLKERINTALERVAHGDLSQMIVEYEQSCREYGLVSTNINLMSVRPNRVNVEEVESTSMGRGNGTYFKWFKVDREHVQYDESVASSDLFGPCENGKLTSPRFGLARQDLDLCNVFFALAEGMYDLQELPALTKLHNKLSDDGYQAFIALAAHMPPAGSMQPYTAEVVLAIGPAGSAQPPLFNLSKDELVQSNCSSLGKAGRAKPAKVLYKARGRKGVLHSNDPA